MRKNQIGKEINKHWTEEQWDEIREKVKERKEKWANEGKYYSFTFFKDGTKEKSKFKKNGENYGFKLKPTYTREEILGMCEKNKITLPESLEYYLTNISREIFCNSYPHTFTGYVYTNQPSNIPLSITHFSEDDMYDSDFEETYKDIKDVKNGEYVIPFAQIGEGGCAFSDQIILKGNQFGTIWHSNSDSFLKTYDSFQEYLEHCVDK